MNTLPDYTIEQDGQVEETLGKVESLYDRIVYRVPAKDETEVRMAALESLSNFISQTGLWKKGYSFMPLHIRQGGWFIANNPTTDNIVHVDGVEFSEAQPMLRDDLPGIVMPGVPHPFNRNVCFSRGGSNKIDTFEFNEQGRLIFRYSAIADCCGMQHHHGFHNDYSPSTGFGRAENNTPAHTYNTSTPGGVVVCTLGVPFTNEDSVPMWILQRHGNAIADGAAHILTVGASTQPTRYGLSYQSAIQEVIGRTASGGAASQGTMTAIEGSAIL